MILAEAQGRAPTKTLAFGETENILLLFILIQARLCEVYQAYNLRSQ